MDRRRERAPTSRVRFGFARVDITPPVGIYHRMWGAARHDRATGVHRPILGDVLVFGSVDAPGEIRLVRAHLDLVGLIAQQYAALVNALGDAAAVGPDRVDVTFSHTHASGWYAPDRFGMPGGELIEPFLKEVGEKLAEACEEAISGLREVLVTYASGHCGMAADRDYRDEVFDGYVCGYNPEGNGDDTLLVGRLSESNGRTVATVVNYACHPTTLAWKNTLISPDYVGAMRTEVERVTDAPCTFALAPCGDLGPKDGFVGDLDVAEKNGRQLGFAALSVLMSMGPPGTDFEYRGPVISGATIGAWAHAAFGRERLQEVSAFARGVYSVDLPMKKRQDPESLRDEVARWSEAERAADAAGAAEEARSCGARAERARRWLARIANLPPGETYPYRFSVCRMGDSIWVTCGGEPYSDLQVALRRRFPRFAILVSPLAGNVQVAYLLRKDAYGKGLYQEEPSSLAPGCLEILTGAIAERIGKIAAE